MKASTRLVSLLTAAAVGANAYVVIVVCDASGNNCRVGSANVNVKQTSEVPVGVEFDAGNDQELQGDDEGSGANYTAETVSMSETFAASEASSKPEGEFAPLYVKGSPLQGRASTTYYNSNSIGACECAENGAAPAWTKNFGAAWNGVDYKVYSVAASPVIYYGGSGGYGRCGGPHGNCGVCVEAVNNAAGHRAIFVINDLCPAGSPWCSGDRLHFDLLVSDATTQHPFGGNVEVDFAEIQCPAEVQQMRASTCFCLARNEISPEHLTRHLLQKAQPSGQQHIRY